MPGSFPRRFTKECRGIGPALLRHGAVIPDGDDLAVLDGQIHHVPLLDARLFHLRSGSFHADGSAPYVVHLAIQENLSSEHPVDNAVNHLGVTGKRRTCQGKGGPGQQEKKDFPYPQIPRSTSVTRNGSFHGFPLQPLFRGWIIIVRVQTVLPPSPSEMATTTSNVFPKTSSGTSHSRVDPERTIPGGDFTRS
jgi:hypothetical protein